MTALICDRCKTTVSERHTDEWRVVTFISVKEEKDVATYHKTHTRHFCHDCWLLIQTIMTGNRAE
jgi:hypothetical protein